MIKCARYSVTWTQYLVQSADYLLDNKLIYK
jgi:hypothetical protein